MGAEISIHRSRTVSPVDEGMTHRFRNNYHPLHFHLVHGENIRLSLQRTVAWRSEGFCKGIAFSDRPVMICEPVYIKFLEISTNWSGALRIGFTMNDPNTMKSKLPKYACPDLTSIHGNWAKAIAERLAKKDSILFYYVDQNGDVHYGIDTEEHGVFFGGVNTTGKLWAVLDIYGNTVGVEFIDASTLTPDSQSETASNSIATIRNPEDLDTVAELDVSSLNFDVSFHYVHGKNATLKQDGSIVARKLGFHSCAYAFTEEPVKIGQNIVFQILKTDDFYNGALVYGITSCDPININPSDLPDVADDLLDRLEYWVVRKDFAAFQVNDIIVYSLSAEGEVTVVKNCEQRLANFHVDPTQPLWLFINVTGAVSEVRFIGASIINVEDDLTKKLKGMKVSLVSNAEVNAGPSSPRSSKECVICLEESANCVVYRCGHVCMCYDCANKIWKPSSLVQCPMCRKPIQDIIKIY